MKLRLLTLLALLPSAQAHTAVDAGNVVLEWHTDANERLEVDADTTLSLALKVEGKVLSAARCHCTLLLYKGAVSPRVRPTVLKTEVDKDGALKALITVTEAGAYALVVDGKPLTLSDFAPFRTTLKLTALNDVYNGGQP